MYVFFRLENCWPIVLIVDQCVQSNFESNKDNKNVKDFISLPPSEIKKLKIIYILKYSTGVS